MDYNLLTSGIYWGYNPLTNHLLTSRDIQVFVGSDILDVDSFSGALQLERFRFWVFEIGL